MILVSDERGGRWQGRLELADRVALDLQRSLLEEGLRAGDRLPPERELAVRLGASRATVRDALRELELKGLVERRQGRGTIVVDHQLPTETSSALLSRLAPEARRLAELMDFRAAIEPPIAARAARYASRSDVGALEALLAEMEEERSPSKYADLDARFHHAVARAAHNQLLVQLVELTADWTKDSRAGRLQGARRRARSLDGHRRLTEVIRNRDPAGASEEMLRHILEVARELERRAVGGPKERSDSSRRL